MMSSGMMENEPPGREHLLHLGMISIQPRRGFVRFFFGNPNSGERTFGRPEPCMFLCMFLPPQTLSNAVLDAARPIKKASNSAILRIFDDQLT
jgi:hypothetical protein